jgi:hypothetical protein
MIEPAHFDFEDFVAAENHVLVCAHRTNSSRTLSALSS